MSASAVILLTRCAVPLLFIFILSVGLFKKVKVYDCFLEGAAEGLTVTVKLLPTLVGVMTAVGVFRASGALDYIIMLLKPFAELVGIPPETMPLALLRPFSGSASLALVADIFKTYGPDSYIGRVAATMMGSTETTFYTLAVYFGSVGVKNIRYSLAAALIADAVGIVASAVICTLIFGR